MKGRPRIDLTGARFGHLTVIRRAGENAHGDAYWECECACGSEGVVVRGNTLSRNPARQPKTRERGCGVPGHAKRIRELARMDRRAKERASKINEALHTRRRETLDELTRRNLQKREDAAWQLHHQQRQLIQAAGGRTALRDAAAANAAFVGGID